MFYSVTCLLILVGLIYRENPKAFEMPTEDKYKAGKKSLEDFQSKAEHSDCWKKAIANLERGCRELTDVEQSYLAVDFTNCHLKKSGRRTYNCSRDKSIEECTGNMSDLAFNAYTTFFTHTTNICFYLQSIAWQERTEDTISKLSSTSEEVADQLENSMKKQLIVLKHQNKSLENQEQIMQQEQKLSSTLKSSTSEARQAFTEMKTKANEQKAIFTDTFEGIFHSVENIKQLQAMILGEFITLQSLAFHFVAVCVSYFFTSSPRTASARLGLFIGLAILIATERVVTSLSIGDGDATDTGRLHFRLWLCRKIYILVATVSLLMVAYRYQDFNKINYSMLLEIQKQIKDLKVLQSTEQHDMKSITYDKSGPMNTAVTMARSWAGFQHSNIQKVTDSADGFDIDSSQCRVDDSYDETFVPDDSVSESESESSEYQSVCSNSFPDISTSSFLLNDTTETLLSCHGRRKSGQKSSTPRQSKSKNSRRSDSPSHRYNLRPRNSQSSPYSSSFMDHMPSPSTLEELVQTLKQTSTKYTAVMKKDRNSRKQKLFSSDEEK